MPPKKKKTPAKKVSARGGRSGKGPKAAPTSGLVSIRIPADLRAKVEKLAAKGDTSMTDVIVTALRHQLGEVTTLDKLNALDVIVEAVAQRLHTPDVLTRLRALADATAMDTEEVDDVVEEVVYDVDSANPDDAQMDEPQDEPGAEAYGEAQPVNGVSEDGPWADTQS